ncbi:MAG: hypothetical protein KA928_02150 [Longilinea sp.]|jgi:hypothetical protein|nr:hypothetical protein [Longilinea sp.]
MNPTLTIIIVSIINIIVPAGLAVLAVRVIHQRWKRLRAGSKSLGDIWAIICFSILLVGATAFILFAAINLLQR